MKQHILLIDDDKDEVLLFSEAMNAAGIAHKCTWAQGVVHALSILNNIKPDIIFIDLNMPIVDGMEGIRRIRDMQSLRATPVILYSNSIDQKDKAMRLGATDCLKKPDTLNELALLLADTLRVHRSSEICT